MQEIDSIKSLFEMGALVVSFIFFLWIVKFIITKLTIQIEEIKNDVKKILFVLGKGGDSDKS